MILGHLWKRTPFIHKEKLDIGCGCGIHAIRMKHLNRDWAAKWTGIELSKSASEWGKGNGVNVIQGDAFTYDFDKKFDVFFFFDSLEHIENHERLARRLIELGTPDFQVFGNVPLYASEHEYEINVDKVAIGKFLADCGFKGLYNEIYGIDGLPYMIFEGQR